MKTRIDLTGQRFGKLIVIGYASSDKHNHTKWKCKCDCGGEIVARRELLRRGTTKSCGCDAKIHKRPHGKSAEILYSRWIGIKSRCYRLNSIYYNRYGGRGITMCEEWRNDFQAFYEWAMANGYREDLTIDRINNDGNYEPSNCRWATPKEQANNTRRNRFFTYKGEAHTIPEWADIIGINAGVLQSRICNYGWDIERALTTPVKKRKRR